MSAPLRSAGRTDTGKIRRRNEDAILVGDDAGLWAVADGLGGHAAGDVASNLIVERLAAVPPQGDALDFVAAIEDALEDVNADLRGMARERRVDVIASTVVVLVYDTPLVLCGWVGDSRAYRYTDGRLVQITRDHLYGETGASERWSGGADSPQPSGGMLSRAVGAETRLYVDWAVADPRPGTRFVLCSDGLNKEVSDAEIAAACQHHASPAAILDELFRVALERGARDNISAIVVQVQDGARAAMPVDAINAGLRRLDAAHREGGLERETYRARRRKLCRAAGNEPAPGSNAAAGAPARSDGGFSRRACARLRALFHLD